MLTIRNCKVVDIEKGTYADGRVIRIEGGIIADICREDSAGITGRRDTLIDAQGAWVFPGLIDCHVHICQEGVTELAKSWLASESEVFALLRAARNLSTAISAGITLLRDAGTYKSRSIEIKKAIESSVFVGPRMVVCGSLITPKGGHAHEIGVEVQGVDNLRRVLRQQIASGADFVKIVNDPIGFSLEELNIVVEEAHELGVRVACHAFTPKAVQLALDAKADTIEHGVCFDNTMIEQALRQGTILVPTYFCAVETCRDTTNSLIKDEEIPIYRNWFESLEENLPKCIEAGIKIAAGTDAGYPPITFDCVVDEVCSLVSLGAPVLTALQSATKIAAEAVGMQRHLGSIEKGKLADLIVLSKNPLEDIQALRHVKMVIKDGRLLAP